jgi:predicted HTH transcriptional regulator
MRDEMLNHGLDRPVLGTQDGYFEVTFYGPGDCLERLKVPAVSIGSLISPSVESQLNDRQKEIVQHVIESGSVTSGWCRDTQGVTYDTANRDLKSLMELKVLRRLGEGRSTKYVLWEGVDPSA